MVSEEVARHTDLLGSFTGTSTTIVIIVSLLLLVCSSLVIFFICSICKDKSMDYEFDANNVQVIYNPSAGGARDLPFTDTYGVYRSSDIKGRTGANDFVVCNPAVTALPMGEDNGAFIHSFSESNNNSFRDNQDHSITFHNVHFENNGLQKQKH